jgi:uncharacterized protein (TIGR03435 family)
MIVMNTRRLSLGLLTLMFIASAQQPRPQFEVASVKVYPMAPNSFMMRMNTPARPALKPTGNRLTQRFHVQDLVMNAYGLFDYQISGLPDWAQSPQGTVYEIDAKAEGDGTPTPDQLQQMLQSLLADRFGLRLHREMKETPVYALVAGKNGSKMRELAPDEQIPTFATRPPEMPTVKGNFYGLFSLLRQYADRPVVDETGLNGRYEYPNLGLSDFGQERRADPVGAQSTLMAAVQDKLGLELEPRKANMEIFVVDHVEPPSPN